MISGVATMEIAMFVYEFPPRIVGGLGTYAMEISQQFIRMGHDVTVFTMNDGNLPIRDVWQGVEVHRPITTDISETFPSLLPPDVRRFGRGMRFFSDVFVYNILSVSTLVNELLKEERRFDVVAGHDWLSIVGAVAAKQAMKKPLVFHVHSTEKGRTMGGGSRTIEHLEYRGGHEADLIVTVSHAMRDELAGMSFPADRLRVCWNGVDPSKYDSAKVDKERVQRLREKYKITPDEIMILHVGRLTPVKGADRLVQAMPHVLKSNPRAKLVILGVGDMDKYLAELIKSLNLENVVTLNLQFVPEDERILHYAACDLAAFPSIYEPFGIVSLEAMSMGKPVVVGARGISGMREQIIPSGPDQCGFHVNPLEPSDIAWGINCTLSDPSALKRLGENARKRVLEYFTWEKVAQNTIGVYEELLAK